MDKTSENSFSEGFDHKLKIWEDSDVLDDWVGRELGYAKIPDVDETLSSSESPPDIVVVSESKDRVIYRVDINSQDVHSFDKDLMINIDFFKGKSIVLTFLESSSAEKAWNFICNVLGVNPENRCTKTPHNVLMGCSAECVDSEENVESNEQDGKDDFDAFANLAYNDASGDEPNFDSFGDRSSKIDYDSLMDHDQDSTGIDSVAWGTYQSPHSLVSRSHDSLPDPDITTINEIRDRLHHTNQETLGVALVDDGASFLSALFIDTFREVEELGDQDSLETFHDIAYTVLELRNNSVLECVLSKDIYIGFLGALEHRPNGEKLRFREFVQEKAKFRQVVTIPNEHLVSVIHRTWRVRFLRDVVLPIVSDGTDGQNHLFLSNYLSMCESEVLSDIQSDVDFLRDVIACLSDDDTLSFPSTPTATPRSVSTGSMGLDDTGVASPANADEDGDVMVKMNTDSPESTSERGTAATLAAASTEIQPTSTSVPSDEPSLFDIIPTDFLPLEFVLDNDLDLDTQEDSKRHIYCPKFSQFSQSTDVYKKGDEETRSFSHNHSETNTDTPTIAPSHPPTQARREALRFLVELFDLSKEQPPSNRESLCHTLFDPMSKLFSSLVDILRDRNAPADDVRNVLTLFSHALAAGKNLVRRQISEVVFSSRPVPDPSSRLDKLSNSHSMSVDTDDISSTLRSIISEKEVETEGTMALTDLESILRRSFSRLRKALRDLDDEVSIRYYEKIREYSTRINVYTILKITIQGDRATYVTEEMLIQREQRFISLLKLANKMFAPLGEHGAVISLPDNCKSLLHLLVWRAVDDPCIHIQGQSVELLRNMMNMDGVANSMDEMDAIFCFDRFSADFFAGPFKWMLFPFVHPDLPQLKLMSPATAMKFLPAVLKAQGIVLPNTGMGKENVWSGKQHDTAAFGRGYSKHPSVILTRFLASGVIDRLAAGFSMAPIPSKPESQQQKTRDGTREALANCTNVEKLYLARDLYEALGMDVKMLRIVGSETYSSIHSKHTVSEFLVDCFMQYSDKSVGAAVWSYGIEVKLMRLLRYPQRTLVLVGIRLLKAFVNMNYPNFLTPHAFVERNLLSAFVAAFLTTIAIPTGSAFDSGSKVPSSSSTTTPELSIGDTLSTASSIMDVDHTTPVRKQAAVENHSSVLAMLPNSTRDAIVARQRELASGASVRRAPNVQENTPTNTNVDSPNNGIKQRMKQLRKRALFPRITLLGSAFIDFVRVLEKTPKRLIWSKFSKNFAPFVELLRLLGLFPTEFSESPDIAGASTYDYDDDGLDYEDDFPHETDDYLDSDDGWDGYNNYELYDDELLEMADTSESDDYMDDTEHYPQDSDFAASDLPVRHGGISRTSTSSTVESTESEETDTLSHLPSVRRRKDTNWRGDAFNDDEFDEDDDSVGGFNVFSTWKSAHPVTKQKMRKVHHGASDTSASGNESSSSSLDHSSPTKGTFTSLLSEQVENAEEEQDTTPGLPVKPLTLFPTSYPTAGIHDTQGTTDSSDTGVHGDEQHNTADTSTAEDASQTETTLSSTSSVADAVPVSMDDEWEQVVPGRQDSCSEDDTMLDSSASTASTTSELNVSLGALNTTLDGQSSPASDSSGSESSSPLRDTSRSPLQFSLRKSLFSKPHAKTLFASDADSTKVLQPFSGSLTPVRSSMQPGTSTSSTSPPSDSVAESGPNASAGMSQSKDQENNVDQFSFE